MAASTPRTFSSSRNHEITKEAISEETHTSFDEVAKIYDEELSTLAAEAKITQYLGVLASRRVRMKLRKH
jgi:RNase H-fold protein (predicted Holliday junction resolvase)